jgi:tRNA G18 (ribose-2'-O)-methylase SpoU
MAPRWLAGLADVLDRSDAPCYVVPEALAEEVTGFHVHRGALASLARRRQPGLDEVLDGARQVLVLEDVVDHTNVGAAFRSAAGLGVDAVLVSPRCADPLYRRSVRVSMGTVLSVPWTRLEPWPAGLGLLRERGFTVAALALAEGAVDLAALAADPPERLALVLGTEGDGLAPATLDAADLTVRIPMTGGVDSLNVAAATAVAVWALRVPPPPPFR